MFARDLILRGVATFLCLFSGCTPIHPFVDASVFNNSRSQPNGCDTDYALRSSRDTQVVSIMSTPDCKAGSRGPLRLTKVREGRRRREAPPTDASRESEPISPVAYRR